MKHTFGGLWTRKKLAVLEDYLKFYTTALRNKPFTLHYADAFAGTGSQNPKVDYQQKDFLPEEDLDGSVRIALEVEPGFNRYHFNDLDSEHAKAIKEILAEYPNRHGVVTVQDANVFVTNFCSKMTAMDRAVLFLDPYSTELDWGTLATIAESEKIDLWLLFPLSAIVRMTPTDGDRIRPEWGETLGRLLGTDEWQKSLYKPKPLIPMEDLFGDIQVKTGSERLNIEELQNWLTERLRQLFQYVAKPVLLTNNKRPLFLFYFAVSNPSEKAWRLADKVVKDILKKHQNN